MSVRGQRCLFIATGIAWGLVGVCVGGCILTTPGIAHYAAMMFLMIIAGITTVVSAVIKLLGPLLDLAQMWYAIGARSAAKPSAACETCPHRLSIVRPRISAN